MKLECDEWCECWARFDGEGDDDAGGCIRSPVNSLVAAASNQKSEPGAGDGAYRGRCARRGWMCCRGMELVSAEPGWGLGWLEV